MKVLLSRLFPREEINGAERCPTYLYRWTLLNTRWGNVYLHKFVADDWSRDLHDHPKRFISIGLWGSYIETTPGCRHVPRCVPIGEEFTVREVFRAPWIRTFPAEHIHRLSGPTPEHPCWTLVIVGLPTRSWGFWHFGEFIPWRKYVAPDSKIADRMKACS